MTRPGPSGEEPHPGGERRVESSETIMFTHHPFSGLLDGVPSAMARPLPEGGQYPDLSRLLRWCHKEERRMKAGPAIAAGKSGCMNSPGRPGSQGNGGGSRYWSAHLQDEK